MNVVEVANVGDFRRVFSMILVVDLRPVVIVEHLAII
jgi:hypothetical protein